MIEYIGVRFKKVGKIYYCKFNTIRPKRGDFVIAELDRGIEYGKVEIGSHFLSKAEENSYIYNNIIRIATARDKLQNEKNKLKEKEAFVVFLEKIKKHNLSLKLIDVELTFDCSKITFNFISDQRVDFRDLVKDLASIFKMRIELKQVGARDKAKFLNSIGMCGRSLCCGTFLGNFQPVSIKMAKDQGLSLNPTKISGVCGRLMCCLKYEESTYEELNLKLPRLGDVVSTPDGEGTVIGVNVIQELIKVGINAKGEESVNVSFYNISEIDVVKKNSENLCDKLELNSELAKLLD